MSRLPVTVLACLLAILTVQPTMGTQSGGWALHVVDTEGDVGLYTAITLDSLGNPVVSYHDESSGTLKLARLVGSAWALEVVDDTQEHVGHHTSIALDAADNPRISYGRFLNNSGWLKYAAWDGTEWQLDTVDQKAQGVGKHTSLVLDLGDNPHISYTGFWKQQTVKYARWTGSDWETQSVFKGGGGGGGSSPEFYMSGTSIILDGTGAPCIAFWGNGMDADVDYACLAAADWDVETIDSGSSHFGSASAVVLDGSGVPHVSYYHRANAELRYARWDSATATWDVEVVDSAGDVGMYSSIDVDGTGAPGISYYDRTNGFLKFASRDALTGWTTQTVDSDTVAGLYTSLVIDGTGTRHVSYYDQTNGNLKYGVARQACATDADCDDGSECTVDTCDTSTASCRHVAVADNSTCSAGDGICCNGACSVPRCSSGPGCDDGEACTIDSCMNPGTCGSFCENIHPTCGPADGCCAPGCDHTNDLDCPSCVPTHAREKGPRCRDGIDNDCDGSFDASDPDCN